MVLASLLGGTCLADTAPGAPAASATAASQTNPPAQDHLVCQMVTPTGSHMGHRVCLTQSQWDQTPDNDTVNTTGVPIFHPSTGGAIGPARH
jgi:hypothetical protein